MRIAAPLHHVLDNVGVGEDRGTLDSSATPPTRPALLGQRKDKYTSVPIQGLHPVQSTLIKYSVL
jgi:hypothetical protein